MFNNIQRDKRLYDTSRKPFLLLPIILFFILGCVSSETYYSKRGDRAFSKGYDKWAIENYNTALKYNPNCAKAWMGKGVVWLKNKQYVKAIINFNKAIELDSTYQMAYLNRASAWFEYRNPDIALADCNNGLEINPDYDEAYILRARIWYKKGDYLKTKSDLLSALKLNNENPNSNNKYAWLLSTCPDSTIRDGIEAIKYAQKAVQLHPSPYYMDTLGAAYAEAGQFCIAIETLKEAINILKSDGKEASELIEHLKDFEEKRPLRDDGIN
jgi:tetratricopeptide (TPR) repeat protein